MTLKGPYEKDYLGRIPQPQGVGKMSKSANPPRRMSRCLLCRKQTKSLKHLRKCLKCVVGYYEWRVGLAEHFERPEEAEKCREHVRQAKHWRRVLKQRMA